MSPNTNLKQDHNLYINQCLDPYSVAYEQSEYIYIITPFDYTNNTGILDREVFRSYLFINKINVITILTPITPIDRLVFPTFQIFH